MTSRLCSIEGCDKRHYSLGWCKNHHARWRRHGNPLGGGPDRSSHGAAEAFLLGTVLPFEDDSCLAWPFSRMPDGYGQIRWQGRPRRVHIVVCTLVHGDRPSPSHEVAHSCGKGHLGCVNPNHLRWATSAENSADMVAHGTSNRGERSPMAKLTEADVFKIRSLQGRLFQREIAAIFGVSPKTIGSIHRGVTWGWLHKPSRAPVEQESLEGF